MESGGLRGYLASGVGRPDLWMGWGAGTVMRRRGMVVGRDYTGVNDSR